MMSHNWAPKEEENPQLGIKVKFKNIVKIGQCWRKYEIAVLYACLLYIGQISDEKCFTEAIFVGDTVLNGI